MEEKLQMEQLEEPERVRNSHLVVIIYVHFYFTRVG